MACSPAPCGKLQSGPSADRMVVPSGSERLHQSYWSTGDTIRRLPVTGYSSLRPARARPAVRRRGPLPLLPPRPHRSSGSRGGTGAHDHKGTPVDQPGGKFLGDVLRHVVAPRVRTLGDLTPFCAGFRRGLAPHRLRERTLFSSCISDPAAHARLTKQHRARLCRRPCWLRHVGGSADPRIWYSSLADLTARIDPYSVVIGSARRSEFQSKFACPLECLRRITRRERHGSCYVRKASTSCGRKNR